MFERRFNGRVTWSPYWFDGKLLVHNLCLAPLGFHDGVECNVRRSIDRPGECMPPGDLDLDLRFHGYGDRIGHRASSRGGRTQ
jgi:hypothetical protein